MRLKQLVILGVIIASFICVYVYIIDPSGFRTTFLSTLYPNNPEYSPSACAKSNGIWVKISPPAGNMASCYYPPDDEGKTCYEDADCDIHCITSQEKDPEGFYVGKCGKYSIFDCRPHITTKTKDKTHLQSGACV